MHSNVDQTKTQIEQHEHVEHVSLDGSESGVIVRAIVSKSIGDAEDLLDHIETDVSMSRVKDVGFGLEVEIA